MSIFLLRLHTYLLRKIYILDAPYPYLVLVYRSIYINYIYIHTYIRIGLCVYIYNWLILQQARKIHRATGRKYISTLSLASVLDGVVRATPRSLYPRKGEPIDKRVRVYLKQNR
jgi:hypothetical protein